MRGRTGNKQPPVVAIGSVAALAFVVLAVLVALGQLDTIDRYAVHNLMPNRAAYHSKISLIESLLSYRGLHFRPGAVLRLPASLLLSSLLVGSTSAYLWRRDRRREATTWAGIFVTGIVLELLCKAAITRPSLYGTFRGEPVHLTGFDSSFPSGHAVRAVILAIVVGSVWPALRPLLALWLVAVAVTLEVDGIHTPSDITGGLLLASALASVGVVLTAKRLATPARSTTEVRRSRFRPT